MLPSGCRDRFTTFDALSGSSEWAGVSFSTSAIKEVVEGKWQDVSPSQTVGQDVDDGKTTWDLPETAYQEGFCEFFNQPHRDRVKNIGNVLRESAIPAISALLGNDISSLLCQQYGFTSVALDVSTDPAVAIFFATHLAPFYNRVDGSPHLGVVYRWPKDRAMIAEDLLCQLEGTDFDSVTTSFRNYIADSPDLEVAKDSLVRYTSATSEWQKRMLAIAAVGEKRELGSLRFPVNAFRRSRMGRQYAALLWPTYKVVKALRPRHDEDVSALIGDLVKTHHGEVFYFRHGETSLPARLNKFVLWPSIKPTDGLLAADFKLELRHSHFEFEDRYLEMMLRFFSSCGPCNIVVAKQLELENRQSLKTLGVAHGVVDLGYLLHPSDVGLLAARSNVPETYMPIPIQRYIQTDCMESIRSLFASAIAT